MSKVTILSGSPRKGGNTDILVKSFIDGLNGDKNEVELISVQDYKVSGCIGCNFCYRDENNSCAIKDDMQEIYKKLAGADVIVIATPVYFYGVSSQLKAIIDRLHNPIRSSFNVKKLVLLGVCADTIPTVFDSIITMYNSVLKYFSLENGGVITVCGVKEKGDIIGNDALEKAYELATEI